MGIIAILIGLLPEIIKAVRSGIDLLDMTPKDRAEVLAYLDVVGTKLDAAAAKVAEYTPIPKPQ